jgi:endonuclease YncB( thermonuclease family)
MERYEYFASYLSNYDGDTIKFTVDLGFEVYKTIKVRVRGVNTSEIRSSDIDELQSAYDAKKFTKNALRSAEYIIIKTYKTSGDKYKRSFTRYIADVFYFNNNVRYNLADELRKNNFSK